MLGVGNPVLTNIMANLALAQFIHSLMYSVCVVFTFEDGANPELARGLTSKNNSFNANGRFFIVGMQTKETYKPEARQQIQRLLGYARQIKPVLGFEDDTGEDEDN